MKIRVAMKDPDAVYDAIKDAVNAEMKSRVEAGELTKEEARMLADDRMGDVTEIASRWFLYGEYLVAEMDTEAKTCRVVPRDE